MIGVESTESSSRANAANSTTDNGVDGRNLMVSAPLRAGGSIVGRQSRVEALKNVQKAVGEYRDMEKKCLRLSRRRHIVLGVSNYENGR